MSVDTVGRLRELLESVPDYWPIGIRITVGGDLGTDDVDVVDLHQLTSSAGPYVVLEPDADNYNTTELIDNGLAAFHAIEEATHYDADEAERGEGFVRYTRDESGNVVLDHVSAWRVTVYDGQGPPPSPQQ